MIARNTIDTEILKAKTLCVFMLLAFSALSFSLWKIQVAHGAAYEDDINRQSMRRVKMPGIRGRIVDRDGKSLADNKPSYCIALYLEELRRPGSLSNTVRKVMTQINEIAGKIGLPPEIGEREIRVHMRKRLPLPLIAWKDLSEEVLAKWAEKASDISGADIYVETVRIYPENQLAAHVLGYVGRAAVKADEEEKPYHYYMPEMVGRSGLEKHFDEMLRGESGGRLVRVDVSGYKFGEEGVKQPSNGQDIQLTIDSRIQRIAEKALSGRRGSVVMMNPQNGDVLAMASSPGFDPNDFVPSISVKNWAKLRDDPGKPMLNRSVAGEYTPGSTFKPVVALAALEAGEINAHTAFHCPGYFQLGGITFRCWLHSGHGDNNVREALKNSCNVFFFNAALKSGSEVVIHMAEALGLGRKTGIDIDYERAGLLPDKYWKRQRLNEGWRDGDTCNLSIGQGYLTATPLQMAVYVSALANKGTVYKPRLLKGIKSYGMQRFIETVPEVVNRMNWSAQTLKQVRGGMKDVVMAPTGTGKRSRVHGIEMAGKTGTAEYGRKGSGKKYAWMMAFAPYDNPQYAAVLVLEEAASGGGTAAPLMHNIMQAVFFGSMDFPEGRG